MAPGDKNANAVTDDRPWRALPPELAPYLQEVGPAYITEMILQLETAIPEFARPGDTEFVRNLELALTRGFDAFVNLILGANEGIIDPEPYRMTGADEFRTGRSIASLQATYRLGGRIAWRHLSAAAIEGGAHDDVLSLLAEAVFAFIDKLCQYSLEGYADAERSQADSVGVARRKLFDLLVTGTSHPNQADFAYREARWRDSGSVAALVLDAEALPGVVKRLDAGVLYGTISGVGCVLFPDPDGPGRRAQLKSALRGVSAALGPESETSGANRSFRWAHQAMSMVTLGELPASSPLMVDQVLVPLLLRSDRELVDRIVSERLAPLHELRPAVGARMADTLLCWLRLRGDRRAMAAELHIHVQTVAYRVAQLREIFGSTLDRPDARFELEIALRSEALGSH
ncbi:MAG: helix-turn-helix domain-containing protein [Solirubrobacterales bacterium]